MKKLIALLLAVVFASTSLVGCGGETKATPKSGGTTPGGAPPGGAPPGK